MTNGKLQRHTQKAGSVTQEHTEMRVGPFPDPHELEKYKEIGGDELINRIFSYAEREQGQRIITSRIALVMEFIKEMSGMIIAAVSMIGLGWLALEMLRMGQSAKGTALLIVEVIGVVYAFTRRERVRKKDNSQD